jgi:hypothetical protein
MLGRAKTASARVTETFAHFKRHCIRTYLHNKI